MAPSHVTRTISGFKEVQSNGSQCDKKKFNPFDYNYYPHGIIHTPLYFKSDNLLTFRKTTIEATNRFFDIHTGHKYYYNKYYEKL